MKHPITLCCLLFTLVLKAQFPQLINYQGVARNNNGNPITNQTIGLKFQIHELTAAGTVTFTEQQTVTTNSLGLFSTQIGKNSNLSVCDWSKLQYFLEVSIDPAGGTSYTSLGTQQITSVPFALYAKTAGNAPSYVSSPNVTITTGNVMDLTPTGVTSGTYGTIGVTKSTVPTFSVDNYGRLTTAQQYSANLAGDISGRLDSQYVSKFMGAPLSAITPTTGQVLQFNGTNWVAFTPNGGGGPWTFSTGVIYPANNTGSDKVAIGQPGGNSMLTVNNTSNSAVTTSPVTDIKNNNPAYNSQGVLSVANYTGDGAALYVQNSIPSFGADGIIVNMNSGGSLSAGIRVTHIGGGRAGDFSTTSPSNANDAVFASSSSSLAFGLRAQNLSSGGAIYASNSTPVAYTGQFNNSGGGGALQAYGASGSAMVVASNGGQGTALYAYNTYTSTSSGSANGVYGLTYNSATNIGGVVGENTSFGAGVVGLNTNSAVASTFAHGVRGETNNSAAQASGVFGKNYNVGAGVTGINVYSAASGNAHGVYGETGNTSISSVGVFGKNTGIGHGVFGTTNSTATNASGVYGENNGVGFGVYGVKPAGAGVGSAGRFEILNTANNADALFASTSGTGAAIHAANSTAATSALSLLVENGHIKSLGNAPTSNTIAVSLGGFNAGPVVAAGSTDVKGVITVTTNATGSIGAGQYVDINVAFNKPYAMGPTVVITPYENAGFSYMVTSMTSGNFVVRIKNITSGLINFGVPANAFRFSYLVIE